VEEGSWGGGGRKTESDEGRYSGDQKRGGVRRSGKKKWERLERTKCRRTQAYWVLGPVPEEGLLGGEEDE